MFDQKYFAELIIEVIVPKERYEKSDKVNYMRQVDFIPRVCIS